ncbi:MULTISPECIES: SEL1-like repeat protein [unclassified Janthinobacterium]|uniref:SEL1-like repeat protein n=1 Tax=unclassified Janthinobacterium TaxID=2610881 RepID=UPI000348B6B3|nr:MULTISPECIES: SEL1-like repeat protein [unclassified Janthinobacterium]MEC5164167.1 TPR repeat protein [Janthinobacterium sp. CG_S6]
MGNRTFLYTTDKLPTARDSGEAAPTICHEVGSGNNFLPPLWRVLFSTAASGPAQDFQQVFLPSVCGGIYAERTLAEQRLFTLLDFVGQHPMLPDAADFQRKTEGLRQYLATLSGLAYSADLNEYFMMVGDELSEDAQLESFMRQCAKTWQQAEQTMRQDDYRGIERLYNIDPRDAANSLGFACWSHDYFHAYSDAKVDATFGEYRAGQGRSQDAADGADHLDYVGHDLYSYNENGMVGLCRHDGTPVLPAEYDDISAFDYEIDVAGLCQNDLWGIYDANGKVVLAPVLDELYEFQERVALARLDGRYGYLDSKGRWLVRPRYDDAFNFSAGLAAVVLGGLTGYVNQLGCEVIAPQFLDDSGSFLPQGQAMVQTAQGYGVIDRVGAFVIPATYSAVEWDEDLVAWLATGDDGHRAVFFGDGRPWFSGAYEDIDCLVLEYDALVRQNGLFGTVRRDGSAGIPVRYDDIELLLPPEESEAGIAPALYAVTSSDGLTGACLANGELCAPLEFCSVDYLPFTSDVLEPPLDSLTGLPQLLLVGREQQGLGVWSIDRQEQILPCEYAVAQPFRFQQQQVALLAHAPERGYVIADAAGKLLSAQPYDWIDQEAYQGAQPWHLHAIARGIGIDWSEGRPILGWREHQGWRLYPDGREESELIYQLRRAFDESKAPAIVPHSVLKGLLNIVRRKKTHVLPGATDPDACKIVGDIYTHGQGVGIDMAKACTFYATAAAGGNEEAQYLYGYYLMEGHGCEADAVAARLQFEPLVPGNKKALNALGNLYEYYLGDEVDTARARAMYIAAAEGGESGLAQAQTNAGNCWRHGIGGPVDKNIALEYYELAAEATASREGNSDACHSAAELYGEQAAAAHAANQPKEHKRALQRAIYFYKLLLGSGLDEGHIGLARCFLGQYGGASKPDAARSHLRQVWHSGLYADEAHALWEQYQLG